MAAHRAPWRSVSRSCGRCAASYLPAQKRQRFCTPACAAKRPVADRLWRRVDKTGTCWEWTGPLMIGGRYGGISVDGRDRPVHRVAYELLVGPIPEGLELDHLCRNRRCVRPDHLEPVTHAVNMARSITAMRTTCLRGHPRIRTRYGRICRVCRRQQNVEYRERRRLAA